MYNIKIVEKRKFNLTLKKDAILLLNAYMKNVQFNKLKKSHIIFFYKRFFFLLNFFLEKKFTYIIENSNFVLNKFNRMNSRLINQDTFYLNYNNVYYFWHYFNQDPLIKLFVNLTMKNGSKSTSLKNVFSILFFIKKLIGVQPITILKKFLINSRFLFDMNTITYRKNVVVKPKLLSLKSQFTRSLKHIFNNFNLNNNRLKKKKNYFFSKNKLLYFKHII